MRCAKLISVKRLFKEFLPVLVLILFCFLYYQYTPKSAHLLHEKINNSNPTVLNEQRMNLSQELHEYLASGLPKNPGKTPTILNLFLGNQRKLLDLRFKQAINEIKTSKIGPGEFRIWSLMNMGVVIKTKNKIIAIDTADMSLSGVQKELIDTVDLFLVTHGDADHYDQALLKKALQNQKSVVLPQNLGFLFQKENYPKLYQPKYSEPITIDGVKITAFQTDHRGDGNFMEASAWYLVEINGIKILHTGDGRDFKNKFEKDNLAKANINIFLCNAKATHPLNIRDLKPDVVVPLHLYKFMHSREELEQSTFGHVTNLYTQYKNELKGINVKLLFPGESFVF